MNKTYNYQTTKKSGDPLSATEWNNLTHDVEATIDAINEGGGAAGTDPHIIFDERSDSNPTGKGNLTIQTTAEDLFTENNKTKGGKINIEPINDLQIKPGDDISLYAHHRGVGNTDQVLLKVLTETQDETEIPANIKINSGGNISFTNKDNVVAIIVGIKSNYTKNKQDYDMTTDFAEGTFVDGGIYTSALITSKFTGQTFENGAVLSDVVADILGAGIGKNRKVRVSNGDSTYTCYTFTKVTNADGVTNINVEDSSGYGYLKVRAQSIDLRCEEHGGISLLPKGEDNTNHMNKIKFEHGGGDGLEFGTFNSEKTSIFTDEYRFNKNGTWKMATRTKVLSDKYDGSDETTHYKYNKNTSDDFYDFFDSNDNTCTTEDIINAGNAFNPTKLVDNTFVYYEYSVTVDHLDEEPLGPPIAANEQPITLMTDPITFNNSTISLDDLYLLVGESNRHLVAIAISTNTPIYGQYNSEYYYINLSRSVVQQVSLKDIIDCVAAWKTNGLL